MDCSLLFCPWNFPCKNTGMGCHALLQGIFLTQGSNPCLLGWQVDSLSLSHLGSPCVCVCVCVHVCIWAFSHILAIADNVAINMRSHVFFFELVFLYSSDKYSEVEVLHQMVVVSLIFLRISILFSTEAAPIYIPTNGAQGISFLHMLFNASHFLTLDNGCSGPCAISCGSDSAFLLESGAKHLLTCLLAVCVSSLEKCLCISSAHSSIVFF